MIKKIQKHIEKIKYFGLELWLLNKLGWILYPRYRKIGLAVYNRKHAVILKFLQKNYAKELNLKHIDDSGYITENCPIWVCWWQGEENAPDLVKSCIKSIRKYSGRHKVNVITIENYSEFIEIPKEIISKFNDNKISYTHLSDLLRCCLLEKYGGIWCDATLFLTKEFDREIYNYGFYTMKNDLQYWGLEIEPSKCFWRVFFMASVPKHPIFTVCKNVLIKWLKSDLPLIDYFTLDYIILYQYYNIPFVHEVLDDIPYNNLRPYDLYNWLNDNFCNSKWENLCKHTYIHKLSIKGTIITRNNDDSFFSKILLNS